MASTSSAFSKLSDMEAWLKRYWRSILVVPFLVAGVASAAFFITYLLTTPFDGPVAAARVTVGALALIGVLVTATISLIGFLLKQSIDRRTLEISLTEQRRLQLEAAVETVKLIGVDSGDLDNKARASKAQASAALLVLAKLGEVSLAVDLAAELWPAKQVTSTAAARVIDYALAKGIVDEDKASLQRSTALLLLNNYDQLYVADHQYEWPKHLEHWPELEEFDPEARFTIALALSKSLEQHKPTHLEDFRVKLLREAREQDSDQKVKKEAVAALIEQQER